MTIDIAALRAKYPNPIQTPQDGLPPPVDTYCVGGALALELGFYAEWGPCVKGQETPGGRAGWNSGNLGLKKGDPIPGFPGLVGQRIGLFPTPGVLEMALMHANPNLSGTSIVRGFAETITRENDEGNFETAWAALADALGYGKEGWTPADDESVAAFLREATV